MLVHTGLRLAAIINAAVVVAQHVIDLSGDGWTVSNKALDLSVPGRLPSQAHLDLYAAGAIGNPLHGLNDFNLRWVAWSNWTYTSEPIASLKQNASATYLVFQGLDTFTSIEFCGQHVASTDNQFRQYHFEVSDILSRCSGEPTLSIKFGSAPNIVDAIAAQIGQQTWPFGVQQTFELPNRWFMRKEQSDFGWDWGPALTPAGPWQPAYVVQLEKPQVYVRNTLVDIYRQGQRNNAAPDQSQPWVLNASIDYLGSLSSGATLAFTLRDSSKNIVASGALSDGAAASGQISGNVVLPADAFDLWWPNGLGNQCLYDTTIDILDSNAVVIASVQKRVGFRTIVLNESIITEEQLAQGIAPGNNWHFEINGHEFFAKGSNIIPPDVFWPRVTVERTRQLFDSVIDSKQNMLRVWSSGAYSPDFIYDLADEMGILLWSEFEFGDALYPVNPEFLANVYEEVNYQVRRVNSHPSLAFWAGGNELENLELSLVNQSAPLDQYERLKNQYEKLFLATIVPAVFGNTRSISYAPSSTSNGYISLNYDTPPYFTERYENLDKGSIYGETDYYNYDPVVAFKFEDYPVGRFSNEFGYHSMPSLQSWQHAISPRDLQFNSSVIQLRNHHYPPGSTNTSNYCNTSLGMGEMTRAVEQWYPTPSKTDSVANFSSWCHATQIFQADYYVSQINFYRRGSGLPQRTLGSLYWQLNDIWQAPSWAGIEYDGRWKVMQYRTKDAYSNVIISPFYNASTHDFEIWATSDLWDAVSGSATATWYDWSGNRLDRVGLNAAPVYVGAINSTRIMSTNLDDTLAAVDFSNAVMEMTVFTHTSWFHAAPLSSAQLVDPGLTLCFDTITGTFIVGATIGIAAWVWLDYPAGAVVTFDDNGFWLRKGESKSVGYTVKSDDTNGDWTSQVTVSSIWNQTLPM